MSAIGSILAGVAAKVGAQMVGKVLGDRFGPAGGQLAETVVEAVAERLGVEPAAVPEQPAAEVEAAVIEVEAQMPEMIALWAKGLDGQFALLQTETREGFWQSAWRWGWMYLLALFWVWRMMVAPYVQAWLAARGAILPELVEYAVLLTLTSWFIALYMGGHTVKALGQQAIEAVRAWKVRT
jgi:hypothetical protein